MRQQLRFSLVIVVLALLATQCLGGRRSDKRKKEPGVDGSALVASISTLKENGVRLDWLHRTDRIAFDMLGEDGYYDVYTMAADGSDVKCLTCDHPDMPNRQIGQPAWHPSGKYLVVQAEKKSHEKMRLKRVLAPGAGVLNDLWVLNVETGRARALHSVANMQGQGILHPHFSHDGTLLTWTEMLEKGGYKKRKEMGYWELRLADVREVRGRLELDNVRSYKPCGDGFYENHGLSPDNSTLIFSSNCREKARFDNDIYTLNLKTQELKRLTDEGYNEHAIYSPDGRNVIWISTAGNKRGGTDFWMMNPDGSNKRRLTYFNDPDHPHYAGSKVVVADSSWNEEGTAFAGYHRTGGALESDKDPKQIVLIELNLDGSAEALEEGEPAKH